MSRQFLALDGARGKVNDQPSAPPPMDRASWNRLVERFLGAAREGDLPALEALLAEDVTSWADGGGAISAARRPVRGRVAVARYLAGITAERYTAGLWIETAEVNGAPAALVWSGAKLTGVLSLEADLDGEIRAIRLLVNPAKLAFLARQHAALSRSGAPSSHP